MSTRESAIYAPGWPGTAPTWTSSAKSGVGTSIGSTGMVWFTVSHGIVNEVYYPREDQACTRDLGFIVTDRKEFFSEEKRDARHELVALAEGVPAFRLTNTCCKGRKCEAIGVGQRLRIEVQASALVHYSLDGWETVFDAPTRDTGLGLHLVDLPTEQLPLGGGVRFTFRWLVAGRWEGRDFHVAIVQAAQRRPSREG